MQRSPQADNWLRQKNALGTSYNVAIVPVALKDGYTFFFDNVLRKRNYHVAEHRFRITTIENLLHSDILKELRKDQNEFIQKYPHTKGIFDGLQYIICSRNDGRPFRRDFDEDEFLEEFKRVMGMEPRYPNGYATAVRYSIGNGVTTSIPILVVQVNIGLVPVPMRSFD